MKPAANQFQIEYESGRKYHPDFVVETETELLIVEVKATTEMNAADVLAKARAATRWIHHANDVAREKGKKLWAYLLVPHNEITGPLRFLDCGQGGSSQTLTVSE